MQVQPVEITGDAGDFMFFHPCMIHSRGLNSSRHGSGDLRIASPQVREQAWHWYTMHESYHCTVG